MSRWVGSAWIFATRGDGKVVKVRLQKPHTHMGSWCLDIQGLEESNTTRTLVFERDALVLLAADIVLSL